MAEGDCLDEECEQFLNVFNLINDLDILDNACGANRTRYANINTDTVNHAFVCELSEEIEPEVQTETILYRTFCDKSNPLELFTNEEFKKHYSFSKETVIDLLEMIYPSLERRDNRGSPVPPIIELLVTIRYMCTGNNRVDVDDIHGVSQPMISRFLPKITVLLAELKPYTYNFTSDKDYRSLSRKFYDRGGFPCVVGSLGSIHVSVKNPGGGLSESYLNEFGYYSLKVQLVSGPDLEILHSYSRWPGAMHNNKIFELSNVKYKMENKQNDGILLADSSYQLRPYLFTPISDPESSSDNKYNEHFLLTNTFIECVNLWKKRFKCLSTIMQMREETTRAIVRATINLHNIALQRNENLSEAIDSSLVTELKVNDNKRILPLNTDPKPRFDGIVARVKFIQKYFNKYKKHM